MWQDYYKQPSKDNWSGRVDKGGKRFHETVKLQDATELNWQINEGEVALIGFCSDEGVARNKGRRGAAEGPAAFRSQLATLAHHQTECPPMVDLGDIVCLEGRLEDAQKALGELIDLAFGHKLRPFVVGGGHEVAWAHYLGFKTHPKTDDLAIVNYDAHLDMRPIPTPGASSGTPFLQIAQHRQSMGFKFDYSCLGFQAQANHQGLVETASKYDVKILSASDLMMDTSQAIEVLKPVLESERGIYLTICLDVFSSSIACGVSAPQSLGILPHHILPSLKAIAESGQLLSFDIAELSPPLDKNNQTAHLAASLFYFVCSHWTQSI